MQEAATDVDSSEAVHVAIRTPAADSVGRETTGQGKELELPQLDIFMEVEEVSTSLKRGSDEEEGCDYGMLPSPLLFLWCRVAFIKSLPQEELGTDTSHSSVTKTSNTQTTST